MITPVVAPDLGDFMIILLAGSLAGLRDRLAQDGFLDAADLVGDLFDIADDYLTRPPYGALTRPPPRGREDHRHPPSR